MLMYENWEKNSIIVTKVKVVLDSFTFETFFHEIKKLFFFDIYDDVIYWID